MLNSFESNSAFKQFPFSRANVEIESLNSSHSCSVVHSVETCEQLMVRDSNLLRSGSDWRLFDDDVTGLEVSVCDDEAADLGMIGISFDPEWTTDLVVAAGNILFLQQQLFFVILCC